MERSVVGKYVCRLFRLFSLLDVCVSFGVSLAYITHCFSTVVVGVMLIDVSAVNMSVCGLAVV